MAPPLGGHSKIHPARPSSRLPAVQMNAGRPLGSRLAGAVTPRAGPATAICPNSHWYGFGVANCSMLQTARFLKAGAAAIHQGLPCRGRCKGDGVGLDGRTALADRACQHSHQSQSELGSICT